jgi:hypothetical protein
LGPYAHSTSADSTSKEKKMAENKVAFDADALVNVPVDEPGDTATFSGYVGPSHIKDNVRLYTDLTFKAYFEIPKAAIRHRAATDANDKNSPSVLLVDSTAQIILTAIKGFHAGRYAGALTHAKATAALITHNNSSGGGVSPAGFTDSCISCHGTDCGCTADTVCVTITIALC